MITGLKDFKVEVFPMANKPREAIALENPKIRNYPEQLRNGNTATIVDWLLNLLGVNDSGKEAHHVECFRFINERLTSYTYQEIKEAFLMFVNHELDASVMVTQQLNAVVIGKVMKMYDDHRKQKLSEYYRLRNAAAAVQPEISEEEKQRLIENGIRECYLNFKQTRTISVGRVWIYDWLIENKKINPTPEEKKRLYKEAKLKVVEESKLKGIQSYKDAVRSISAKSSPLAISKVKSMFVIRYFTRVEMLNTSDERALKEILE